MVGHNIGDQVCQIGAQIWHAKKYAAANTETYQQNAKKYFKMNRPVHINKVMRAHPDHMKKNSITATTQENTMGNITSMFDMFLE